MPKVRGAGAFTNVQILNGRISQVHDAYASEERLGGDLLKVPSIVGKSRLWLTGGDAVI